jgi:hypothetical protein
MTDRKRFLATLSASGALLAGARAASAASPPPIGSGGEPAPPSTPPPASAKPAAKPGSKGPSAAALAVAASMRRFDPNLSDGELATIAKNIDDAWDAGAALNPKKTPLHNWDEPVTTFTVRPK